jgi:hypothetical protein
MTHDSVRVIAWARNADEWMRRLGITNKCTRISDNGKVRVSVKEEGRTKWETCVIGFALVEEGVPLDRDDLLCLLNLSRHVYRIKELTTEDVPKKPAKRESEDDMFRNAIFRSRAT